MSVADFLNPDSTEIEEQRIVSYPGASADDVLTVQADGTVAPAAGGSQPWTVSPWVPLTDAQIKALGTDGAGDVEIVAAPGPGKWLNYGNGLLVVDAGAHPYGNIDAQATLAIRWGAGGAGGTLASEFMEAATVAAVLGGDGEEALAWFTPNTAIVGGNPVVNYADMSQVENRPLMLGGWNDGAGPFDGGDSGNSAKVKVWYTIEDLI